LACRCFNIWPFLGTAGIHQFYQSFGREGRESACVRACIQTSMCASVCVCVCCVCVYLDGMKITTGTRGLARNEGFGCAKNKTKRGVQKKSGWITCTGRAWLN